MNLFTYGDNSIRSAFACAVNNNVQQRQSCWTQQSTTIRLRNSLFVRACGLVTVLTKYRSRFLHCSSWIQSTVNFSTVPRLSSCHRQKFVPRLRRAAVDLSVRDAEFNITSPRVGIYGEWQSSERTGFCRSTCFTVSLSLQQYCILTLRSSEIDATYSYIWQRH